MNTLSTRQVDIALRTPPGENLWAALKQRVVKLDRMLAERLDRARRSEHERFLARASDPYQLERLEREWERRGMETWRAL